MFGYKYYLFIFFEQWGVPYRWGVVQICHTRCHELITLSFALFLFCIIPLNSTLNIRVTKAKYVILFIHYTIQFYLLFKQIYLIYIFTYILVYI